MKCPYCAEEITDNSEKCTQCNTVLVIRCPFCFEVIDQYELKCKHCGSDLEKPQQNDTVHLQQKSQLHQPVTQKPCNGLVNHQKQIKWGVGILIAISSIALLIIFVTPQLGLYRFGHNAPDTQSNPSTRGMDSKSSSDITINGQVGIASAHGGLAINDTKDPNFITVIIADERLGDLVFNVCKHGDNCSITGTVDKDNNLITLSAAHKIQ